MILPQIGHTADDLRRIRGFNERARRDALKHIARDMPDPADFARSLALVLADALVKARLVNQNEWHVHHEHAAMLKTLGLVDAGTGKTCLGAFGIKVRRILFDEDA